MANDKELIERLRKFADYRATADEMSRVMFLAADRLSTLTASGGVSDEMVALSKQDRQFVEKAARNARKLSDHLKGENSEVVYVAGLSIEKLIVTLDAANKAIADVRAERDAAIEAENEAKDCFWAIYPDWVEMKGHGITTEVGRTMLVERAEAAEARVKALEDALERSRVAIDDWLNTYASDFCNEARVKEAWDRINAHGATLAYIADVQKQNRAALSPKGGEHG